MSQKEGQYQVGKRGELKPVVQVKGQRQDYPIPWIRLVPPGESPGAGTIGLMSHPVVNLVSTYRWHSPALAREARELAVSLWSADRAGWSSQSAILKQALLRLGDKDRFERVMAAGKVAGVHVEYVGRFPIVRHPFKVSYQSSEWLVYTVNDWPERVPFEAHLNKLVLERLGIAFDTWHIADELPKPSFTDRVKPSAAVAAVSLVAVATGIALVLGQVLAAASAVAVDPALVGTLASKAEPGQADWFIICRWYH